jgi:hypothetical protein
MWEQIETNRQVQKNLEKCKNSNTKYATRQPLNATHTKMYDKHKINTIVK